MSKSKVKFIVSPIAGDSNHCSVELRFANGDIELLMFYTPREFAMRRILRLAALFKEEPEIEVIER